MPPVEGPYCSGCPQQEYGDAFVPFDGTGTNGIMFIAESPWIEEIKAGRNLAGASGYMFDKLLRRAGIERRDSIVANSMWCKARRLGWYESRDRDAALAFEHCRPHLDGVIERMKPKVIIPMGSTALRRICGVSDITEYAGYVLDTPYHIPAVPTYHPSYIMQGKQKMSPVTIFAIRRAIEIAKSGFIRESPNLMCDVPAVVLRDYVARFTPGRIPSLFVDLETPESAKLNEEEVEEKGASWQIVRASFALEDGVAVSFPWQEPYIEIFQTVLDAADEVVEWATNHFDTRRLVASGMRIPGRRVSALWAWHWLQTDLPKALGEVAPFFGAQTAWKHMSSSEPAYYSAMDSLEGRRCYVGTVAALKGAGRWDSFERHCIDADPILLEMGRKGVLIDQGERTRFMGAIEAEHDAAFAELQTLVPDSLRPRKWYKRLPKDLTDVVALEPSEQCATPSGSPSGEAALALLGCSAESGLSGHQGHPELTRQISPDAVWLGGYHYARVQPFLPTSWEQVQRLAEHLKVKLPKKRDAEDDEDVSTERKFLLAPARKHREFRLVLDVREHSKMLSTYQWPLAESGCAVTTYGWSPSTLRKSSRAVNLQNIPKRSKLAKLFRKMIVAPAGHVLVEADYSAIEAVLVGWFACSERYISLARAGVHGWLTAALHGNFIPTEAADLAAQCAASKAAYPADYETCKRVVHMTNYKASPMRMAEEYPDDFPTVAAARKLQDFYLSTEPGRDILKWHVEVCTRASHDCYLDNPYKYRHWFYEVSTWNRRKDCYVPGEDAKRAIAFLPQSTASAIQTEALLRLATYANIREWLRLIIHDSFVLVVPEAQAEFACQTLHTEMTRPIPELSNLVIGCEVTVGANWAEMRKWA